MCTEILFVLTFSTLNSDLEGKMDLTLKTKGISHNLECSGMNCLLTTKKKKKKRSCVHLCTNALPTSASSLDQKPNEGLWLGDRTASGILFPQGLYCMLPLGRLSQSTRQRKILGAAQSLIIDGQQSDHSSPHHTSIVSGR